MFSVLLTNLRTFLILVAISIFLILADGVQLFNGPKSVLQTVTIPIQYGLFKSSKVVTKQFEFVVLSRHAAQENKALTEQLAQVLSENANLRRKLLETEGFLAQQNSLPSQQFNLVAARPIGVSRFLLIDKGSEDGLKVNQAVIYKDNYIGKIKEISPKKSQVMLSSDPDSRVAAYSASDGGKARGVLVGQFGAESLLDKILHQEPINNNDLVYSEGTETEIPKGLILGKVIAVMKNDNEVFKQAKVKPVFEVASLDLVFVVTN